MTLPDHCMYNKQSLCLFLLLIMCVGVGGMVWVNRVGAALVSPCGSVIKFLTHRDLPQVAKPFSSPSLVGSMAGLVMGYIWTAAPTVAISEKEGCIARLRRSVRLLTRRVSDLEETMCHCRREALTYLVRTEQLSPVTLVLGLRTYSGVMRPVSLTACCVSWAM